MFNKNIKTNKSRIEKGVVLSARHNSKINIGLHSSINGPNTHIMSYFNDINIGNYCSIAMGVKILEYNHNYKNLSTSRLNKLISNDLMSDYTSKGEINIGHDVWIGMNSIISSGVSIGNGAVIAAGSIVTRDVEPFSIVAGTPAKIISYRFDVRIREVLLSSNWWDYSLNKIKKLGPILKNEITIGDIPLLKSKLDELKNKVRVLAGVISCGENEYNDCIKSLKNQKNVFLEIFEVKDLGKREAHNKLYKHFMSSKNNYDYFLKLDGDMILINNTILDNLCSRLINNPSYFSLEVMLDDFYTKSLIWGLHLYKSSYAWEFNDEHYFTDKIDSSNQRKLLISDETDSICPAAYHSPNPSTYQCFHFGVHKATKVTQIGRPKFSLRSSRSHYLNYLKSYKVLNATNDLRFRYIIEGFNWAVYNKANHEMANYKSLAVKNAFKCINLHEKIKKIPFLKVMYLRNIL